VIRLGPTLGDCETREGGGQQRKSAIQQKRKLPKIVIQDCYIEKSRRKVTFTCK